MQAQGLVEELFEQFGRYLKQEGYQAQCGQILDATLVPVPKQRSRREENEQIKQGDVPENWSEQPHKLAQKDVDAPGRKRTASVTMATRITSIWHGGECRLATSSHHYDDRASMPVEQS
ncbi:MAG: hypothetical protein AAF703_02615 [Cyanobacteria bacterium P01_D01_bin.105]